VGGKSPEIPGKKRALTSGYRLKDCGRNIERDGTRQKRLRRTFSIGGEILGLAFQEIQSERYGLPPMKQSARLAKAYIRRRGFFTSCKKRGSDEGVQRRKERGGKRRVSKIVHQQLK